HRYHRRFPFRFHWIFALIASATMTSANSFCRSTRSLRDTNYFAKLYCSSLTLNLGEPRAHQNTPIYPQVHPNTPKYTKLACYHLPVLHRKGLSVVAKFCTVTLLVGEMAEWFKAHAWKA